MDLQVNFAAKNLNKLNHSAYKNELDLTVRNEGVEIVIIQSTAH